MSEELRAEVERLLDEIRNYDSLSASGCRLCKYEDGVFKQSCAYHREIEQLENGAKQIAKALATVDREAAELLERDDCEIECEEVREMCRDALATARKLGLLEDKR